MVIMEPVQNAGGSFTPPAGYFQGVRELCDRYGILLCADEVITGFGRIGYWFALRAATTSGPTSITCAKGLSSAYAAIGAVIATDRVMRAVPRRRRDVSRTGSRSAAIRCMAAIALKNIEIMKRERIVEHVRENEERFRATLDAAARAVDRRRPARRRLLLRARARQGQGDAGDLHRRGVGDAAARLPLAASCFERGLICRADDRGDPVVQISPPLVAGQAGVRRAGRRSSATSCRRPGNRSSRRQRIAGSRREP